MQKRVLVLVLLMGILALAGCTKEVTEETAREMLTEHTKVYTYYADRFYKQNQLEEAVLAGKSYSLTAVSSAQLKNATFKDDEAAWKKRPAEVVGEGGGGKVTLKDYLSEHKLSVVDVHLWRTFMRQYGLTSIGRSKTDGTNVELRLDATSGYIYRPKGVKEPEVIPGAQLVKIDENWYYFKEASAK